MMHPHNQTLSSTSTSSSSVQRDRDRQREQKQRQMLVNQTLGVNPILKQPMDVENSPLFPEPVRLEQKDDTSEKIYNTLGDFDKIKDFLIHDPSSTEQNPNLIGISRNEINRRRVNEIFAEMTKGVPNPITGLEDLTISENETTKTSQTVSLQPPIGMNNHHQPRNKSVTNQGSTSNRSNEFNTHYSLGATNINHHNTNNNSHNVNSQTSSSSPYLPPQNMSQSNDISTHQQANVYKSRPSSSSSSSTSAANTTAIASKLPESRTKDRGEKPMKPNNKRPPSRLSSESSEASSSSSSSESSDHSENNDDSSSSASSSEGDSDDDSNSNDSDAKQKRVIKNHGMKPNSSPKDVDAKVKWKTPEDEEKKWALDNFLPPGSQDHQKTKDTQSDNVKYSSANRESLSNDHDRASSNKKSKNSSTKRDKVSNKRVKKSTTVSLEKPKVPSKQQKQPKKIAKSGSNTKKSSKNSKKYSRSKVSSSEDSDNDDDDDDDSDDSHDSSKSHNIINKTSDEESSQDSLRRKYHRKRRKHQPNDRIEEGECKENFNNYDTYQSDDEKRKFSPKNSSRKANKAEDKSERSKNKDVSSDSLMTNFKREKNHKNYNSKKSSLDVTRTTSAPNKRLINHKSNNDEQNYHHRKKPPPLLPPPTQQSSIVQPPLPAKFDESHGNSTKNRIPDDENSWKDVKKRKETSSSSLSSSTAKSKKSQNTNSIVINEPKVIESKPSKNRLHMTQSTPSPTPPPSKSRKSPHMNKQQNENGHLENTGYSRKVEYAQPPASQFNHPQYPPPSLIVSIELPKLNRIPSLDRNGTLDSAAKLPSRHDSLKKSRDKDNKSALSSGGHRSDAKYSNGKEAELMAMNPKSKNKSSEGSMKIKNEINDSHSRPGSSSRHLPAMSNNQLNVPSPQPLSSSHQLSAPKIETSPLIHHQPQAVTNQQHRSPICQTEQEAQSRARTLKRKADLIKELPQQILQYIEASMYFIQAGLIMEQKRTDPEIDKAYQMYRDTLNLIKLTTSKLSKNRTVNSELSSIDYKLTILSYRCQSLLNARLSKMKFREIHENKEILQQFFSLHEKSLGSSSSSSINNQAQSPIMVQPQTLFLMRRQLFLLQHSYYALELWQKAETMMLTNQQAKEFLQQVDQEYGSPLYLSSSMEQLIHHTLIAVKSIKATLSPINQ